MTRRVLVVVLLPHLSSAGDPPPVPAQFIPAGNPQTPINSWRKEPA